MLSATFTMIKQESGRLKPRLGPARSMTVLPITAYEQELLSKIQQGGFSKAMRLAGPPSRQFATAALVGTK